mmetsp:Transcript_89725/g.159474  ORF Transcript_89725/g.159474 Transcript_89725/m.159474 type:complete len:113 (+) Transcript_89725:734-1072(+)
MRCLWLEGIGQELTELTICISLAFLAGCQHAMRLAQVKTSPFLSSAPRGQRTQCCGSTAASAAVWMLKMTLQERYHLFDAALVSEKVHLLSQCVDLAYQGESCGGRHFCQER